MLLIFDLDGTLIDSSQDLAISVNATRAHIGLPALPDHVITSYVGNGATVLIRRAVGPDASEQVIDDSLAFFLKFYRAHALEHTRLYPGIRDVIEQLHATGHTLAVLTNKPERISSDIIGALDLTDRFKRVYGGDSLPNKKPDPIGIKTLMAESTVQPAETVMIGDSYVDVQTARNAGVVACGVEWGFQPDSFRAHPPDVSIRKPHELVRFVSTLASGA